MIVIGHQGASGYRSERTLAAHELRHRPGHRPPDPEIEVEEGPT
jgi:hypothetical protein